MESLYDKVCSRCSKIVTNYYSTSFSLGIRILNKEFHKPIYAIYGFVRFADEIVDTFHDHDKKDLLERFVQETHNSIREKISLNPILHSFQETVNTYQIDIALVDTFLHSMTMDLDKKAYDQHNYEEYILGSAEVVGLMCLKVFCRGDESVYQGLKGDAMRLGSAFQKINFLRDIRADYLDKGRVYFPNLDIERFDENSKKEIESDIKKDFDAGYNGIKKLPKGSRLGVYVAYTYYLALFKKIRNTPAATIIHERIRVPDFKKYFLFISCYLRHKLNMI